MHTGMDSQKLDAIIRKLCIATMALLLSQNGLRNNLRASNFKKNSGRANPQTSLPSSLACLHAYGSKCSPSILFFICAICRGSHETWGLTLWCSDLLEHFYHIWEMGKLINVSPASSSMENETGLTFNVSSVSGSDKTFNLSHFHFIIINSIVSSNFWMEPTQWNLEF